MAALVKYADSDSTKDPESDDEKTGKGKKSDNTKGQHPNLAGHGNSGKRKANHGLDFVANTSTHDKRSRLGFGIPLRRGGLPLRHWPLSCVLVLGTKSKSWSALRLPPFP